MVILLFNSSRDIENNFEVISFRLPLHKTATTCREYVLLLINVTKTSQSSRRLYSARSGNLVKIERYCATH